MSVSVSEMMFGWQEGFTYLRCPGCECLQIGEVPEDLSRFYPPTYYSFQDLSKNQEESRLKTAVKRHRDRVAVWGGTPLGRALLRRFPRPEIECLGALGLQTETRILDIGCGEGALLRSLHFLGFQHLLGIDPFLDTEPDHGGRFQVRKLQLSELDGEWDLIMFHHSLEHMTDPGGALKEAARLLAPAGTCLIRTPVIPCFAWRSYGPDWVQLDAPRHLTIHSRRSISLLAERAGLAVREVVFDSTAFQFWGSEQYRKGIPLHGPRSYATDPTASLFSSRDIRGFRRKARALNESGEGDQAAFFLVRTT